jgi:hypothetical protein
MEEDRDLDRGKIRGYWNLDLGICDCGKIGRVEKGTYAGIPAITSSPFIKLFSYASLTFKKIFIVVRASST